MLLLLRFRLVTELLAEKPGPQDTRVFRDAGNGRLQTALATWDWALKAASKNFKFGQEIDITSVRPEPSWTFPQMILFARTYMHQGRDHKGELNRSRREHFQCIPSGSLLEHRLVISQGPDTQAARHRKDLREPTIDELRSLFEHIGYYLGLSPWGNRLGYGRFEVESLEEISDASIPYNSTHKAAVSGPLIPGQQCPDDLTGATGDTPVPDLSGEVDDPAGVEEGEGAALYRNGIRTHGPHRDDVSGSVEESEADG